MLSWREVEWIFWTVMAAEASVFIACFLLGLVQLLAGWPEGASILLAVSLAAAVLFSETYSEYKDEFGDGSRH